MGRTFDHLSPRQSRPFRIEAEMPSTMVVAVSPVQMYDPTDAVDDPQAPFIEVGGKGPPMVSAGLKDTPAPGHVTPLAPFPGGPVSTVVPSRAAAPSETPKALLGVDFFPLPEMGKPSVPDSRRIAPELIAFHRPDHAASVRYRDLMEAILGQLPRHPTPLIYFTPVAGEPDSAIAVLNLAITRSRMDDARVLVIEADHSHPAIASRLGIASMPGLRELLARSIPLSLGLHRTAQPHLYALPPGDANLPVTEQAEARLPTLLASLRQRFDCILVSGAEWGYHGSEDWVKQSDATYVVVDHERWDSPPVEAAHEEILEASGKLRGYVTTRR